MGYRTVLIINNDLVHTIKGDPKFGKSVYDAVCDATLPKEYRINTSRVVYTVNQSHVDDDVLLHISNFDGEQIASTRWPSINAEVNLLKQMADKLGYKVSKKRANV